MITVEAFYSGSDLDPEQRVIDDALDKAARWMEAQHLTRAHIVSTHVNSGSIDQGEGNPLYFEYTLTLMVDLPESEAAHG